MTFSAPARGEVDDGRGQQPRRVRFDERPDLARAQAHRGDELDRRVPREVVGLGLVARDVGAERRPELGLRGGQQLVPTAPVVPTDERDGQPGQERVGDVGRSDR